MSFLTRPDRRPSEPQPLNSTKARWTGSQPSRKLALGLLSLYLFWQGAILWAVVCLALTAWISLRLEIAQIRGLVQALRDVPQEHDANCLLTYTFSLEQRVFEHPSCRETMSEMRDVRRTRGIDTTGVCLAAVSALETLRTRDSGRRRVPLVVTSGYETCAAERLEPRRVGSPGFCGARSFRASVASLTSALTSMTHLGLYSVTLCCNLFIKVYSG